jgi:hypothetical protein
MNTVDILKKVKDGSITIEEAARTIDEKSSSRNHIPFPMMLPVGMTGGWGNCSKSGYSEDYIDIIYDLYKKHINIGMLKPRTLTSESELLLYNEFIDSGESKIVYNSEEFQVINIKSTPALFYYAQRFNWTKTYIFEMKIEHVDTIYLIIDKSLLLTSDSPDRMFLVCTQTNTFINFLNETSPDTILKLQKIVGKEIIPVYLYISKLYKNIIKSEGLYIVENESKKYGVINMDGVIITNPLYDYICDFKDNVAIVCDDEKKGVIDNTGKIIIELYYNEISRYENVFIVNVGGKTGILSIKGDVHVPLIYDNIYAKKYNNENYYLIMNDDMSVSGLLDSKFVVTIKPIYYQLQYQNNNLFSFKTNDGIYTGIVNIDGKIIIKSEYKYVAVYQDRIEVTGFKDDRKPKKYTFDFEGKLIKE